MKKRFRNQVRRSMAIFCILSFFFIPLVLAVDTDEDGYDDDSGADNCPGFFNPLQENTEAAITYDSSQLMVASNIGDWQERFDGDPRTTTFVGPTQFSIGSLVDGSKTGDYEDFWFNHGDEANPGSPAELVVKLPTTGMVTQIILNNISAPEDVSDPDYAIYFSPELGDYTDPSFIPGGWSDVPSAQSSGTILSGEELTVTLSNPIAVRYIKVELISSTDRVTLNEIEIVGNPEHVGDGCDVCWAVGNLDQADSNNNCPVPDPGTGYASDPLCGDVCEPLPDISISSVAINETDSGTATMTFRVELTAARWEEGDDITFNYETVDNNTPVEEGDAEDGVDYTGVSGGATISSGDNFYDIEVLIDGDNVYEPEETFVMNITSIAGNVSSTANLSAVGTITNDDALPEISVDTPVTVTEGDPEDPSPMVFTFSLVNPSDKDVNFTYTINNVTTSPGDYEVPAGYGPTSGSGTILAYTDSTTITVDINDDSLDENNEETFTVVITQVEDEAIAVIADPPANTGIGTITDNDDPEIGLPTVGALSFTENDTAIIIDDAATVTTSESDYDGGNLTVDFTVGATANDRLAITNNGAISTSGSNVRYSGITFGTFAGGTDGSTPLVITFNVSAFENRVEALMRSITYQNVSENPTEDARTIRFVLTNQGGGASNAATRDANITAVNNTPTLDSISNPAAIDEDTTEPQVINLAGITSGAPEENQLLLVTVVSDNTGLIPNPTVTYTSAETTGTLSYVPVSDANGTANITVTVTEDGATENATVQQTFIVSVTAVNDQPTLDTVDDPAAIDEDAEEQMVDLTGITTGALNETQTLIITATSDNTDIIPDPDITYMSPDGTGSLSYTPVANAHGVVTITVTVTEDGAAENPDIVRTFDVVVNEINDSPTIDPILDPTSIPEETGTEQVINLSGISTGAVDEVQTVSIMAVSDNTDLIPHPAVTYDQEADSENGALAYTPIADAFGTAVITVTVDDGAVSNNLTVRTFTVEVAGINDQPTLDDILDPLVLNEDQEEQIINMSGISTGSEMKLKRL